MNLTEELDRSFDSGPAHRPIEDRLVAGRRLVRRRRAAASAAALAVIAVVGATGVALTSVGDSSSGPGLAAQPPKDPDGEGVLVDGEQVGLDRDGTLHTAKGVEVIETVRNPMGVEAPQHSLGLVYTYRGDTYWGMLESSPTGGGGSTEIALQSFPTFEYWLADQVALEKGEETLALVTFGEGETLVPRDGVQIIRQTGDLHMMPRSFAGPNARTAVAEVTYQGERWYVLARQIDDYDPEYFPSAASVTRPTLEQFLTYAADSYANGTGLR